MNRAEAAIAAEILEWAKDGQLIFVNADRAVKVARRILIGKVELG